MNKLSEAFKNAAALRRSKESKILHNQKLHNILLCLVKVFSVVKDAYDRLFVSRRSRVTCGVCVYALAFLVTFGVASGGQKADEGVVLVEVKNAESVAHIEERLPYSAFLTYPQFSLFSDGDGQLEAMALEEEKEDSFVEVALGAGSTDNVLVQAGKRYYTETELQQGLLKELVELAPAFIEAQNDYGIDAVFLSAVAALESGWGTSPIRGTNLFGFGKMKFESRSAGISHVASFLVSEYLSEGGQFYRGVSVDSVQHYYCPNSSTWAPGVRRIMQEIVARIEENTDVMSETSYMVVRFPLDHDSGDVQRLREFVMRRAVDAVTAQAMVDAAADEDFVPPPDSLQAKQLGRIANLRELGIVLPDYDGWGTNIPRIYDIELSDEIQYYALEICEAYGIGEHFELVLAKMFRESSYREVLTSKTNDYGVSQINICNHSWLRSELGITDFQNYEQSILCGVHMLSSYLLQYKDLGESGVHRALMSYNGGAGYAEKLWKNGTYSTKYSRWVIEARDKIINEGGL